jgi:hypothetical protein
MKTIQLGRAQKEAIERDIESMVESGEPQATEIWNQLARGNKLVLDSKLEEFFKRTVLENIIDIAQGNLETAYDPEEKAGYRRRLRAAESLLKRLRAVKKNAVKDIDIFTKAYLEAALWAELDDEGDPLDDNYTVEDIDPSTLEEMVGEAKAFQEENEDAISGNLSQAGHDFWLTRNRHGAGFWDGGWPEDVEGELTEAAHDYGEYTLYVGDDGVLYGSR